MKYLWLQAVKHFVAPANYSAITHRTLLLLLHIVVSIFRRMRQQVNVVKHDSNECHVVLYLLVGLKQLLLKALFAGSNSLNGAERGPAAMQTHVLCHIIFCR